MAPEISIVMPVFNERGSIDGLVDEIMAAFDGLAYEMIFVDDCSADGTREALAALRAAYPRMRVVGHQRRSGQSRAILTGALVARGPVIVMLDGDGQYDPADAPRMIRRLLEGPPTLGMVAGERIARRDDAARRIASRLGNVASRKLLGSPGRDAGCGLKVFRREVFLRLPYFDHMHRFLPALMTREGYDVAFEPVDHRPRRTGTSKYSNLGRLWVTIPDILGVFWLGRRRTPPGAVEEF